MDQASDNTAAAEPKEEKSLLEKLAEMEEKKVHDMKWTPLPPPNLELYLRKPVVLLNWDDNMSNNTNELTTDDQLKEYAATAYDVINLDSIADDDNFADISQLTARLEDAEKELSILGSQDKDSELENQGEVVGKGGNDHIPPAPDFNKGDSDDDDEYGSGSDMDLFGDEDYDCLYDNVDQELQQGGASARKEERRSSSALEFSLPALMKVGSPPSMLSSLPSKVHPHAQEQGGSETKQHLREGSSSRINRSAIERTLEAIRQYADSDTPPQPAPQARSSSSEVKLSPNSDYLDLPPVNWGRGSRPMTASTLSASSTTPPTSSTAATGATFPMHTIKEEQPKPHCSKDMLRPSTPLQSSLVAEKCPICNITFPVG